MRSTGNSSARPPDQADKTAVDNWLRTVVLPAYDAYEAGRSRGISLDEVREHLRNR